MKQGAAARKTMAACLRAALAPAAMAAVLATLAPVPAIAARQGAQQAAPQATPQAAAPAADSRTAAPAARPFHFSVIGHPFRAVPDESVLRRAISEASQDKPAFIVATGIKAQSEACSDRLYAQRRDILDGSPRPLVLLPAGSDWADCRNSAGRSNAIERLNRIREVFYPDNQSLGVRRMPLTRLSANVKFRGYAENAYWEQGGILFATLNVPDNNNHYLPEAGRNSEYEDRLVANRAWLHRLFLLAQRRNLAGMVLFTDGDIKAQADEGFSLLPKFSAKQDGYAPVRKQVRAFADKYAGKVLLVDSQGDAKTAPAITWRGNLGRLGVGGEWETVRVQPGTASLFSLKDADSAP